MLEPVSDVDEGCTICYAQGTIPPRPAHLSDSGRSVRQPRRGVVLQKGVAFLAEIPQNYRFDGFALQSAQTRCAPTMEAWLGRRSGGEKQDI